ARGCAAGDGRRGWASRGRGGHRLRLRQGRHRGARANAGAGSARPGAGRRRVRVRHRPVLAERGRGASTVQRDPGSRRHLLAALRRHPPRKARPRTRAGGRTARRDDLRADARAEPPAGNRRNSGRYGARPGCRPGDGGVHVGAARPRQAARPAVLVDGGHRAAPGVVLGPRGPCPERETFSDLRRMIIYGQRTADDRLAFGGRGAPYHFRSRVDPAFDRDARVHDELASTLVDLFPALGPRPPISHRWGGPLGVPRDWTASVGFDRRNGLAWGGGYVGDGVAASNLAGRTLADLIVGQDSRLTRLPWVGHRWPRWEPEPLRWLAINAGLRATELADAREDRTGK